MSAGHRAPGWRPRPWLAPLGWLYLGLARAHHGLYDLGLRRAGRAPLPVVSVGNLTAGGTGKTPAVRWLAEELHSRGRRVAVASRGYGGRRSQDPLLVARGGRLQARAEEAGDEAVELARDPAVHAVVVGRDRLAAARLAAETGAGVVVLDDGFQHRRLHRVFDLVLVDADRPWQGAPRGLPAGMLREPLRALERADAILLTRAPSSAMERSGWLEEEHLPRELHRALQRLPGPWRPPVAAARHRPAAWVDESKTAHPPEALAGRSVLALSAIGAPEGFESTLRQLGARVAGHRVWPDHHRFTAADLSEVAERKRALGEPTLITTAKDAVRWPAEGPPITVLTVRLEVAQEAALLEAVMAALGGCCRERG